MTLTELGIGEDKFYIMAEKAVRFGELQYAYVGLAKDDVVGILRECL